MPSVCDISLFFIALACEGTNEREAEKTIHKERTVKLINCNQLNTVIQLTKHSPFSLVVHFKIATDLTNTQLPINIPRLSFQIHQANKPNSEKQWL